MAIEKLQGFGQNISSPLSDVSRVGKDQALDSFSATLARAGEKIAAPHIESARAVDSFTHGMDGRIHETMMAVEKADISLKYMVNVRNKLIEAYREVMKMGT